MKRLFFFFIAIIVMSVARAQLSNGDFSVNSGNNVTVQGSCATFSSGSVPNWFVTHGTPNISGADNIFMWAQNNEGEGVAGGYSFIKGQKYCVQFGLVDWDFTAGSFLILACNGVVPHVPIFCGDAMPVPPTFQIAFASGSVGSANSVQFVADRDYSQIMICPTSSTSTQAKATLDWVRIYPICNDPLVFNSGQIPSQTFLSSHISVGSSFGGSGTVTVDPNDHTTLISSSAVEIQNDFTASASGGTFIAQIDYCPLCQSAASKGVSINASAEEDIRNMARLGAVKSYEDSTLTKKQDDKIDVYPNPAASYFVVKRKTLFDLGTASVIVRNTSGEILFKGTLESVEDQKYIDVSDFTPGIYWVQIQTDRLVVNKKLIKSP